MQYKKCVSYLGLVLVCFVFGFTDAPELGGIAFSGEQLPKTNKLIWLEGRLGFVPDGDSFSLILKNKTTVKIRLKGIDAPERGQGFSLESRSALLKKLKGEFFRIRHEGVDDYGRVLGTLFVGERNINQEMVSEGFAWAYVFKGRQESYGEDEKLAREKKRGLWKQKEVMAPWDYRKKK